MGVPSTYTDRMNFTGFKQLDQAVQIDGLFETTFFIKDMEYQVKVDFQTHYEDNETGRHECYQLTRVVEWIKFEQDGTEIEITPEINEFIIDNLDIEA